MIGEKPRTESIRVGKKKPGSVGRPVKVTFSSSVIVNQILSKARRLRTVDKYKAVFISPDRSPEQRDKQRLLVQELKKRTLDEPGKRHFIKGGSVCIADKHVKVPDD